MASDANEGRRHFLKILFDKYIPRILDFYKRLMKPVIPLPDINFIQTLCEILQG